MFEKVLIFKINGKSVEIVDWDITIDEIEMFKRNVAFINSVEPSEIEVDTIEVFKPEVSTTTFVTEKGLEYKAPNNYAIFRPVDGLKFSMDIDVKRYENGKETITADGLNTLLEKINAGRADDVIIYS